MGPCTCSVRSQGLLGIGEPEQGESGVRSVLEQDPSVCCVQGCLERVRVGSREQRTRQSQEMEGEWERSLGVSQSQ